MRFRHLFFPAVIIGVSVTAFAQTQDSHIRSEYLPEIKMTKVETDTLFVSNTPEQFMQLGFIGRYAGQQLVKPPKNITITMFSNSPKPLYQKTKEQNLVAITDGESWKVGDLQYWLGRGSKADKGREMFASESRPGLGLQNPLPSNAKVAQGRTIDQLWLEWLTIELNPEALARMARAQKLAFQIGETKFQFTDNQLKTLRAFASSITPP